MKRRDALVLLGILPFAPASRAEEAWPTKPVRIVVPFGPGGSGDIVSRIIGHELEKRAGQPFIIENKPGATAMVGTAIVRQAPADGYTLLHGSTSSLAANPSLYKQMTYDPDDFTTVAVDGTIPGFMLVAKDAPYGSVREFVAWAKTRQEPIFSGYGNTSSRVPSALFAEQSGVTLEEVAYKDAVPAIQDLIGGRIHLTFPDVVIGESYVRSGQVRALAVTSPQRAPQFPDLEAIAETYPGFEAISFLSFTVRKEVPVEIQRKLNGWVMEILYLPDVHKRLLEIGIEIGITPPRRDWDVARSDAFVKRERELWTKYIKLAKIEPQ